MRALLSLRPLVNRVTSAPDWIASSRMRGRSGNVVGSPPLITISSPVVGAYFSKMAKMESTDRVVPGIDWLFEAQNWQALLHPVVILK